MELQQFTEKVTKALYQYYDSKVKIETHQVYKNNGILLQGICALQEGKNIAPTVYLNDFFNRYREGESLGSLIKKIIDIIEKNQVSENIDVNFFTDYEKVKRKLVLRLIHRDRNKELLKTVPFQPFEDLAVVCHCQMLTRELGTGSILIHKQHLRSWNISEEQLFADAVENSPRIEPYCIMKMSDVVRNIMKETVRGRIEEICEQYPQDKEKLLDRSVEHMVEELEGNQLPMYVLTNVRRYYGAACIVYPGVLQKMAAVLQDDYYIIPSSVHEIIFLSKSKVADTAFLNEMIQEVNQSQVDEEEWLLDHTYLYQRETKMLIPIADQK